jgi:hypothetical protein
MQGVVHGRQRYPFTGKYRLLVQQFRRHVPVARAK